MGRSVFVGRRMFGMCPSSSVLLIVRSMRIRTLRLYQTPQIRVSAEANSFGTTPNLSATSTAPPTPTPTAA